jgi:hypothetical protein
MKKLIIGAIVGGILLFLWQFLSWSALGVHESYAQYTEKQDAVVNFLSTQFTEDGQYLLPTHPKDATAAERESVMKAAEGKPWAIVSYHKSFSFNMTTNMIRGFLVNVIAVGLFCWILSKMNPTSFGNVFIASLFVGIISFLYYPYTNSIWFKTPGVMGYFADALVGWGLVGAWLGWWYKRR